MTTHPCSTLSAPSSEFLPSSAASKPIGRLARKLSILGAMAIVAALAGCGMGTTATSSSGSIHLAGNVHGGQQAVVGAQIFLYDSGTAGNASAATNSLTLPVLSGVQGSFSITGDYTCPNANDQVYLAAIGGNSGSAVPNSHIALVAALGACGTLQANAATTFVTINEVSTAAAAWALGAFASGPANVGASATNGVGIGNAMRDSALLVVTSTGLAPVIKNQTIETAKLYALADALAVCVNSDGSGCTNLFTAATPPSGSVPNDTFTAALNIVHYPANNVGAVFSAINAQSPFPTTLTQAPSDWTMSDTINLSPVPGGTSIPLQLALDGNGAVWYVNYNGALGLVTPQGTATATYGVGTLIEPNGVTVNAAGNVWVSSAGGIINSTGGNGFLTKFQSTTGSAPGTIFTTGVNGTSYFYDANTVGPNFLAADSNGNIAFSGEYGGNSIEVVTDAGVFTSTVLGDGPENAVFDSNHGLWIPDLDNAGNVIHLVGGIGGTSTDVACCQPVVGTTNNNGFISTGLGLDSGANLWILSSDQNSNQYLSAVSPANAVLLNNSTTDNITSAAVTGDAGGVMWFADAAKAAVSAISSGSGIGLGAQTIGTSVSPAGGFGRDAAMNQPMWIAPDASGNLWVSDSGVGTMVLFFGLATPTATPQLAVPKAP